MEGLARFALADELCKELDILSAHFDEEAQASEPASRLYIRVSFSILEAMGGVIRQKALEGLLARYEKTHTVNVTALHFLDDYAWRLTSSGKLEQQQRSAHPLGAHLAFSIRTLADVAEVDEDYFADGGWEAFLKAVKVRNRITHPKREGDVRVSKEDMEHVHVGLAWAFNTTRDILHKSPIFETVE